MERGLRAAIGTAATLTMLILALCPFGAHASPMEPAAQASASLGRYNPSPQYHDKATAQLYLPMRDGTRLAVRIDRPAIDGVAVDQPMPVIVEFGLSITPRAAEQGTSNARGYAGVPGLTDHGYVVVQVARRGNGQSFGVRRGYHDRNEAQDAFEVIEWLAGQPWSNGRVGTYGCSNTGDAALQAATMRPPHLEAVWAGCFNWDKYDGMLRGGILAQWGTGNTRTIDQDMQAEPVTGDEDRVLLRQAAEEHQWSPSMLDMWREMPFRDSYSTSVVSRFWAETSLRSYAENIRLSNVALYLQTGWYNESRDQSFVTWANVPNARLIVGPWTHCANGDFDMASEIHRFFDYELKDIDTGLAAQDRIQYYMINADSGREWHGASAWPLPASERRTLYLQGGRLAPELRASSATSFVASPEDDLQCADGPRGPFDHPCHLPGVGTSFRMDPVRQDLTILGAPVASLWLTADKTDANLFLFLEDVAPDGSTVVITEGRLKSSLRATHPHPYAMDPAIPWHRSFAQDAMPLTPGMPTRLEIALTPSAYVLRSGHRLQLSVHGADARERDPLSEAVTISILSQEGRSSTLSIPYLPG